MNESADVENHVEFELLQLASRKVLGEAEAARMRALLRDGSVRWQYLVGVAAYHGIQPLLYYHLRGAGTELVPEDLLGKLRAVVGARSAHSIVLERELGRLASVFQEAELPLLAVKGPVLAHSVYGSVALRPFVDLDLIVDRQDFSRVEALLGEEGYETPVLQPFQKASYLFIHGQYTFWKRVAGLRAAVAVLDVHTAVMPPGYSYEEDFEGLFARSTTVEMAGTPTHALQREDLLQVLCFHGFKNRWDRLKYFCDVAEFLRAYPDLDWDTVFDRARAMRSERVLRLGLLLAQRLLDAPLPEEVARNVERDERAQVLGAAILERLPMQAHTRVEPYWDRVRLNVLAQDGLLGGLRYGAYAVARRASELYLPEND